MEEQYMYYILLKVADLTTEKTQETINQYFDRIRSGGSLKMILVDLIRLYINHHPNWKSKKPFYLGLPRPSVEDGWACGAIDMIKELHHYIKQNKA